MIFHVDANSAYLSWSAIDLLEKGYGADLRMLCSAVAGDPKSRHGIILAKSMEAKKHGIVTGQSLFEARNLCPNLIVVPPNYALYVKCSNCMYDILAQYSDTIQRYSIDECYVKMEVGSPEQIIEAAHEIKNRIKRELGFTVNVGVGYNKLSAKMAGELKKPDMVHTILNREEFAKKLWRLPIDELFMVGRASQRKLKRINIETIGDLAAAPVELLTSLMKSHGRLIWEYANGIDHEEVTPNQNIIQKGFGNSLTISYDAETFSEIKYHFLALSDRLSARLRKNNCRGSLISVSYRNKDMYSFGHQEKLLFFTNDTSTIFHWSCKLFKELWRGEPVRKLGISVGELAYDKEYQLSLMDSSQREKNEIIDRAIDAIRARYGEKSVYRGAFVNTDYNPVEGGVNEGNFIMLGGKPL